MRSFSNKAVLVALDTVKIEKKTHIPEPLDRFKQVLEYSFLDSFL